MEKTKSELGSRKAQRTEEERLRMRKRGFRLGRDEKVRGNLVILSQGTPCEHILFFNRAKCRFKYDTREKYKIGY